MKVLLTGASGQLGQALQQQQPAGIELLALTRQQLDITADTQVMPLLQQQGIDLVINCAAFTAVDVAEAQPQQAYAVNEQGAKNLAFACQQQGARLIHLSTDYVFSGNARQPISEQQRPQPINHYGQSKLAGEQAIQRLLPQHSVIVRSSALYSDQGLNFATRIKQRLLQDLPLQVVADQITVPTACDALSQWLWQLVAVMQQRPVSGIYHRVGPQACSWYEFACCIQQQLWQSGQLTQLRPIQAISTAAYMQQQAHKVAPRPAYSVLANSKSDTIG